MCLDMDQHIFVIYMHDLVHIQSLQHILVDNLALHQYNLFYTSKQHDHLFHDIDYLDHMVMDNMDQFDLLVLYLCIQDKVVVKKLGNKKIDWLLKLYRKEQFVYLLLLGGGGGSWQALNGLPIKPGRHVQLGEWFNTLHSAFKPQTPGHGSLHLLFKHALSRGQSLFVTHSGRQPLYGSPK